MQINVLYISLARFLQYFSLSFINRLYFYSHFRAGRQRWSLKITLGQGVVRAEGLSPVQEVA